jgi:hypothetical protein
MLLKLYEKIYTQNLIKKHIVYKIRQNIFIKDDDFIRPKVKKLFNNLIKKKINIKLKKKNFFVENMRQIYNYKNIYNYKYLISSYSDILKKIYPDNFLINYSMIYNMEIFNLKNKEKFDLYNNLLHKKYNIQTFPIFQNEIRNSIKNSIKHLTYKNL